MSFASLLKEQDNNLKALAITQMLNTIDQDWPQIAEHISIIESLNADATFPQRDAAAYLCAKIYYHLDDFDQALTFALQSSKFKPEEENQFNQCLVRHCIDKYIENPSQCLKERIQLVEKVLQISCSLGNYISAIGVAIDCRRIDLVNTILHSWKNPQHMQILSIINTIQRGSFREDLLRIIVDLIYEEAKQGQIPNEEWGHFVTGLVQLGEVLKVAEVLWSLASNSTFKLQNGSPQLLAYQLCIDMADNQKPQFNSKVIAALPVDQSVQREKMVRLLSGQHQRKVKLYFLKNQKQTDPSVLSQIKGNTDPKFSVHHGGAMMGHAIAQTGTQDAQFLKDNANWATKCNYWQRFTATSTLGLIHKYNIEESQQLMATHLNPANNPFEIGGAYYGLGLLNFATNEKQLIQKSLDHIQLVSAKEASVHGALLCAGLVAFASEDQQLDNTFKGIVQKNESVYGEGASMALGLLHAGSASTDKSLELLKLAQELDKEKIVRTLALAIACINFHQEEKADSIIELMLKDNDPQIRYGGCFTLGLAYAGSQYNNKVIERLLQVSVEDVSDDVRRASVMAFGFVMFKNHEQIPKILRLLILSYNPHIRYGTAIALGVACAGTMYCEAIAMLEPMLLDTIDFVRQGALIALSMVMGQANKDCEAKYEQIQKTIQEIAAKKHETVLTKLGVCLSMGLFEAGGRNMVVSLQSRQGMAKLDSCVGMLWFLNYWFWFPCLSMISLSLQTAAFIGLDENLDIPRDYSVQCNGRIFDYPQIQKANEKKVVEKKTAQLSTTNKVKARNIKKDQDKKEMGSSSVMGLSQHESKISIEHQPSGLILNKNMSALIEEQQPIQKKNLKEEVYILQNPWRILEKQKKLIQFLEGSRFQQLLKDRKSGLVMLIDSTPNQFSDVICMNPIAAAQNPPSDFIFDERKQQE